MKVLLIIAGVLAVLIILIITPGLLQYFHKEQPANINEYVVKKMTVCKEAGNQCYSDIAHTFASEFLMKDILSVFEKNEQDPIFFEKCHTTLHFLGQEEYKITNDISVSLSQGTPICFAGFYHGVLEAYLSDSGLINDSQKLSEKLPDLCGNEDKFTLKKNYYECLHGLGHALMFATNGELPESLKICDSLHTDADKNWCYSGSFMENSTSSTNKDHPSKYLRKDDPLYPCNILEPKYGNMCYTLQSFYFAEISNYDWKENEKLCRKVPSEFQAGCFNAIGQNQVGFTQDLNIMEDNCYLMNKKEDEINCLYGIIGGLGQRYIDGWSKALNFCNDIIAGEYQNDCYNQAIRLSKTWINNEEILQTFCSQINSEIAKNQCYSQI